MKSPQQRKAAHVADQNSARGVCEPERGVQDIGEVFDVREILDHRVENDEIERPVEAVQLAGLPPVETDMLEFVSLFSHFAFDMVECGLRKIGCHVSHAMRGGAEQYQSGSAADFQNMLGRK